MSSKKPQGKKISKKLQPVSESEDEGPEETDDRATEDHCSKSTINQMSDLSGLSHAMILCPPEATQSQLHQTVLKNAFKTGTYFDVKFYLPSQRDAQDFIRKYDPV